MRSLGYRPRDFLVMIGENGTGTACNQVIISQNIPNGLLRLLDLDRLDLTAEATTEPWRRLFNEEVLAAAKKSLIQHNRQDLANPYTRTKFRVFATTYSPD